ncbi:MAG: aminotransferase class V-fold PLP-dependent enzyme [bacterium]
MHSDSIYFDHAATSFPKPPEFWEELTTYQTSIGGSPGRGAHRAADQASEWVYETRKELAALFRVTEPERIVFTANATESLNLALLGLLRHGDHVVTTSQEHNSVVRPLTYLARTRNVLISYVPLSPEGELDPSDVRKSIRRKTRLIVVNHASNVTGAIAPLEAIGSLSGSLPLLVDATQTAGLVPLDVEKSNVALLAFTGHKSLYGPTGVGGLYIRPDQDLSPLKTGGTGSLSEEPDQPAFLPDRYESGTLNMLGIAGLKGSLRFLRKTGIDAIRRHERDLLKRLERGLAGRAGFRLYGPSLDSVRTGTVSLNLRGWEPSEVSYLLDRLYAIRTRSGLHCSPGTHRALGTFPSGTVRVSVGYFNTVDEIDKLLDALYDILQQKRS